MTPKRERFVEEYLKDLNATQAAIRAGYSEKTAYSIGDEILKKPEIAAAIALAKQERSERVKVDQDWVLAQLVENVTRCMQAKPVVRDGKETGVYSWEPTAANGALKLVGSHLGMFVERSELTGQNGKPLFSNLSREQRAKRVLTLLTKAKERVSA